MKLRRTLLSKPFNPWSSSWVSATLLSFLFASLYSWGHPESASWLTANREQVFSQHEIYRLFTTTAMHADMKHFLGNSLFFAIFGFLLNSYFGVFWFPVFSLIAGGAINALTLALYPDHTTLLGASGVVYFMAGAWSTLFVLIERKSHWMKRMIAAVGVSLILLFPTAYEPEVSYLAHGLGFAIGILIAMIYFRMNREKIRREEYWEKDWAEWLRSAEAENLNLVLPSNENIDF